MFLVFHNSSFCQTSYDSTFVQEMINLELKERDKKLKKAYPIYEVSAFSDIKTRFDTVYTQYYLGKEINWDSFKIESKYGFFTKDRMIDSCFYIHAPLFNSSYDKFIIKYEIRFQNYTSFIVDYYRKKRGKWNYIRTSKSFSI